MKPLSNPSNMPKQPVDFRQTAKSALDQVNNLEQLELFLDTKNIFINNSKSQDNICKLIQVIDYLTYYTNQSDCKIKADENLLLVDYIKNTFGLPTLNTKPLLALCQHEYNLNPFGITHTKSAQKIYDILKNGLDKNSANKISNYKFNIEIIRNSLITYILKKTTNESQKYNKFLDSNIKIELEKELKNRQFLEEIKKDITSKNSFSNSDLESNPNFKQLSVQTKDKLREELADFFQLKYTVEYDCTAIITNATNQSNYNKQELENIHKNAVEKLKNINTSFPDIVNEIIKQIYQTIDNTTRRIIDTTFKNNIKNRIIDSISGLLDDNDCLFSQLEFEQRQDLLKLINLPHPDSIDNNNLKSRSKTVFEKIMQEPTISDFIKSGIKRIYNNITKNDEFQQFICIGENLLSEQQQIQELKQKFDKMAEQLPEITPDKIVDDLKQINTDIKQTESQFERNIKFLNNNIEKYVSSMSSKLDKLPAQDQKTSTLSAFESLARQSFDDIASFLGKLTSDKPQSENLPDFSIERFEEIYLQTMDYPEITAGFLTQKYGMDHTNQQKLEAVVGKNYTDTWKNNYQQRTNKEFVAESYNEYKQNQQKLATITSRSTDFLPEREQLSDELSKFKTQKITCIKRYYTMGNALLKECDNFIKASTL